MSEEKAMWNHFVECAVDRIDSSALYSALEPIIKSALIKSFEDIRLELTPNGVEIVDTLTHATLAALPWSYVSVFTEKDWNAANAWLQSQKDEAFSD